jgi:hypothetical protein
LHVPVCFCTFLTCLLSSFYSLHARVYFCTFLTCVFCFVVLSVQSSHFVSFFSILSIGMRHFEDELVATTATAAAATTTAAAAEETARHAATAASTTTSSLSSAQLGSDTDSLTAAAATAAAAAAAASASLDATAARLQSDTSSCTWCEGSCDDHLCSLSCSLFFAPEVVQVLL